MQQNVSNELLEALCCTCVLVSPMVPKRALRKRFVNPFPPVPPPPE